jgi:hypothetical protein
MSKIFLKRINKEISNFNEKKYLEKNNYSDYLLKFLNYLFIENIVCNYGEKDKYFLTITNLQTNLLFLELEIPEHYPFKPYNVVNYSSLFIYKVSVYSNNINNKISYSQYMNKIYEKIKYKNKNVYKFFYKTLYGIEPKFLNLKNNDCYCCSSIVCSNLWSPKITFNNLIFEQLELVFIEKYSSNLAYAYLLNIYNNLYNNIYIKIPNEILDNLI